jgi:hypothetical protein
MHTRKRTEEQKRKHHRHCVYRDNLRVGAKRRASARGLAIIAASNLLDDFPEMGFDDLLAHIRRRWPLSCSGESFESDLRRLWNLSPTERDQQWWLIAEQDARTPQIALDESNPERRPKQHRSAGRGIP